VRAREYGPGLLVEIDDEVGFQILDERSEREPPKE
jgi:hypothetical protein